MADDRIDPGLRYDSPALHPRLAESAVVAELAACWRDRGRVRIESVLAPGLAAELSAFIPLLPFTPQLDGERGELSWRCQVVMPESLEPQYPACMVRLQALLRDELPTLVTAIVGESVDGAEPGPIDVHVFRKGSYIDGPLRPSGALAFALGLTAGRWPERWGGHIRFADGHRWPPAWDALDVFPAGTARMPLITRHVLGTAVMGHLTPAPDTVGATAS